MLVTIKQGTLKGTVEDDIAVFKGIPYAAPPVGAFRWKDPQPPKAWEGVREALAFGNASLQPTQIPVGLKLLEEPVSEDCLYLNIWTPENAVGKGHLPVLVVIHGGGFQMFSGAYDILQGKELAQQGLVVVTLNYRLGMMGFFAHSELTAESEHHTSGNYGILDQIAALKWVQENIAVFGGDPKNVTVSGESAGAFSVSILCMSPLTEGLFCRATAQSGAFFDRDTAMYHLAGLEEAEQIGIQIADGRSIAQLRELSGQGLLMQTLPIAGQKMIPIQDGYVFPVDLADRFEKRTFRDVPLLIGSNCDDGSQFTTRSGDAEELKTLGKTLVGEEGLNQFLAVYPCETKEQTVRSQIRLFSDSAFGHNMYRWAKLQTSCGSSPVYLYDYRHVPPDTDLGAHHSSELLYFNRKLAYREKHWTELDWQLQDIYSAYIVNFAKTGDPNGRGLPRWDSFGNDEKQIMALDDAPHIAKHPYLDAMDFWDGHTKLL